MPTETQEIQGAFPRAVLLPQGDFAGMPALPIGRPLTLIGSGQHVHVRLRSRTVAPLHALILNANGRVLLRDLSEIAATAANGHHPGEAVLQPGATISIGKLQLIFVPGEANGGASGDGPGAGAARSLIIVGSGRRADVLLQGDHIAPAHAVAFSAGTYCFIRDLSGTDTTRVNGSAIVQAMIRPGDVIDIAGTRIRFDGLVQRSRPVGQSSDLPSLLPLPARGVAPAVSAADPSCVGCGSPHHSPSPRTRGEGRGEGSLPVAKPLPRPAVKTPASLDSGPDLRDWGPLAVALAAAQQPQAQACEAEPNMEQERPQIDHQPDRARRRRWRRAAAGLAAALIAGAGAVWALTAWL